MEWLKIVVTILGLFLANLGIIIPLFLWIRSEGNSDRKEAADARLNIVNLIASIQLEIKDFHGRLCTIEERNRKK